MPETKMKIMIAGKEIPVTDVPIINANEKPFEYELEDGTTIRVQYTANSIVRVDRQADINGDPLYLVRNGTVVTILKAGEKAKEAVSS